MAALSVAIGNNAVARGFCCVAVGDDVMVRGAFQVVSKPFTLAGGLTQEQIDGLIISLKDIVRTYQAMSNQGNAPALFGVEAEGAILPAIEALEKMPPVEEKKQ